MKKRNIFFPRRKGEKFGEIVKTSNSNEFPVPRKMSSEFNWNPRQYKLSNATRCTMELIESCLNVVNQEFVADPCHGEQDIRIVAVPAGVCLIKVRESVTRRANDRCCAFVARHFRSSWVKMKIFRTAGCRDGNFRGEVRSVGNSAASGNSDANLEVFRQLARKFHEPTKRNVR